jgi:hypothetical protein
MTARPTPAEGATRPAPDAGDANRFGHERSSPALPTRLRRNR